MSCYAGDYDTGDIWYFPANYGHVILGVDPYLGCTYMTSYDQGDFDERLNARGLSGWYTQAPAAIAAQVHACTKSVEDMSICMHHTKSGHFASTSNHAVHHKTSHSCISARLFTLSLRIYIVDQQRLMAMYGHAVAD